MDDGQRIAEGLSEDARKALLMFGTSEMPGNMLVVEPGDEPVVEELLRACCVSDIRAAGHRFINEQPLGLAVRKILEGEA
jgi:hypothetical protein